MTPEPIVQIGDYRIEAELGAGGMATVYRARHVVLDTVHALKVLDPAYRARPEARQRFLDEAKIQAKHLDHPNIVKVTNIVATADHAALVMELVDGGSLDTALAALRDRPDEIRRIMLAVLDAVGHAHAAGIIHRDLKPANVLLARKDGRTVPKVTDFGIAKVTDAVAGKAKQSTRGDARMGTLSYMSPEQVRRAKDVTPRSDIFSLGAMLYELATGELPFGGDSDYDVMENVVLGRYPPPEQLREGLDPGLAAVIRRALESDPARRFASCAEMAAALALPAVAGNEASGLGLRASAQLPDIDPQQPAAPRSRRAMIVAGLAIAALAFGAGALVVASRGKGGGHPAAVAIDATSGATPIVDAGRAMVLTPDGIEEAPVDASNHDRLQELLAPAVDARPPPPNPCHGTHFGGDELTIAVTTHRTGTCGELYFYDRASGYPVRTCKSSLTGCRVDGDDLTAHYGCSFDRLDPEPRIGTVTMSCSAGYVSIRTAHGNWLTR